MSARLAALVQALAAASFLIALGVSLFVALKMPDPTFNWTLWLALLSAPPMVIP